MFSIYIIICHVKKHIWKICDENVSNKKPWKIKNLFKLKQFSQTVHGKGIFVSIKGHFCLTKRHLANAEGKWRSNIPHRKYFLILLIQIKKKKSKRALFEKASDLWLLYLSKIVSDRWKVCNSCVLYYFK